MYNWNHFTESPVACPTSSILAVESVDMMKTTFSLAAAGNSKFRKISSAEIASNLSHLRSLRVDPPFVASLLVKFRKETKPRSSEF